MIVPLWGRKVLDLRLLIGFFASPLADVMEASLQSSRPKYKAPFWGESMSNVISAGFDGLPVVCRLLQRRPCDPGARGKLRLCSNKDLNSMIDVMSVSR